MKSNCMGLLTDSVCVTGGVLTIGSPPFTGKTTFALQWAAEMAKEQRVGFFTMEWTPSGIAKRLATACLAASGLQMDVIFAGGMTAEEIVEQAVAQQHRVIFVDYLQLISGDSRSKSRNQIVAEATEIFHEAAYKTGMTVVLLSQLSRPMHRLDMLEEVS